MFKQMLVSAFFILASTTAAMATCTNFYDVGSGQNVVNACPYGVIIAWVSDRGPCSRGIMCTASIPANSQTVTSNPQGSGVNWYECRYDSWLNDTCELPK